MDNLPELSQEERLRYSRHLILPEVGSEGQRRLKAARVLVVGAGGLGSPVILYLAAAGVGTIGVVDFDKVDLSNLQRQILYSTADVGSSKAKRASERAIALNPHVQIVVHEEKLGASNVLEIIAAYDVVVDGTDNFSTRYLINDACVLSRKPNVYGSIYRFEGQASVFLGDKGPCYRCLYPEPPEPDAIPNCAEGGVLGVMAGVVGVIQATEAIKLIVGKGSSLAGRLLLYDALAMSFDTLNLTANPSCPVCGEHPTITTVEESAISCASHVPVERKLTELTAIELEKELSTGAKLLILDVRNDEEYELCHLDNALHIPLPELTSRVAEIDRESDIVVYCKGGVRSKKAIEVLSSHGYKRLRNLEGGILAWSRDVDASLTVY